MNKVNLIGEKFGNLTVIKECGRNKHGCILWLCTCECGVEKIVNGESLKQGGSKSCGCLAKNILINRSTIHGQAKRGHHSTEFDIWNSMQLRCYNQNSPSYKNYGKRGIRVCRRWRESFENFYSDMGKRPSLRHSLDRFPDNNGNYEPSNCRWATRKEQASNRRGNRWITYNGKKMILNEWAKFLGMYQGNLGKMLKYRTFENIYNHYTKRESYFFK